MAESPYRSEDVADLHDRLTDAAESLRVLIDAQVEQSNHYFRLMGKRQGVLLALDYLRAYTTQSGHADA